MGASMLPDLGAEILIPVCAVIGIAFSLLQWVFVSKKLSPGSSGNDGVLAGSLVSGVQIAISASNTGGAWDNAKYIEAGASEHARTLGPKGSSPHKAAIGDPLKDTSGPSLNILIKLMAVESLVFAATPWFTDPSLYQFFSRDAISRFKPGIEKFFP
ncbi:hypothetical protein GOBAR_DD33344 [Gossypium barbadense]|nr:hypothetical protein GOBAR_DD33344 [Gossypium barbadense]